jgi:hypothetical protein
MFSSGSHRREDPNNEWKAALPFLRGAARFSVPGGGSPRAKASARRRKGLDPRKSASLLQVRGKLFFAEAIENPVPRHPAIAIFRSVRLSGSRGIPSRRRVAAVFRTICAPTALAPNCPSPVKVSLAVGVEVTVMPPFLYRCPNTGYRVQGFVAEEVSVEPDGYEAVTCRRASGFTSSIQRPARCWARTTKSEISMRGAKFRWVEWPT